MCTHVYMCAQTHTYMSLFKVVFYDDIELHKQKFLFVFRDIHWSLVYFSITQCSMWNLSSPPEIKPVPPVVELQSLNPWTAREVQWYKFLNDILLHITMHSALCVFMIMNTISTTMTFYYRYLHSSTLLFKRCEGIWWAIKWWFGCIQLK